MSHHEDNSPLDFCPNHIKDGAVPFTELSRLCEHKFSGERMQILNQNYQKQKREQGRKHGFAQLKCLQDLMVDSEELVQVQSTWVTSGILVLRGHVSLCCVLFAYRLLDMATAKTLIRWEIRQSTSMPALLFPWGCLPVCEVCAAGQPSHLGMRP